MQTVLMESGHVLTYTTVANSHKNIAAVISRSLANTHTCAYCSGTLLRHIRLGRIYWRCSHCRQEMLIGNRELIRN